MVERLFLAMPRGCLQFVIVVFPDHTHLLFLMSVTTRSTVQLQLIACTSLHRKKSDLEMTKGIAVDWGETKKNYALITLPSLPRIYYVLLRPDSTF